MFVYGRPLFAHKGWTVPGQIDCDGRRLRGFIPVFYRCHCRYCLRTIVYVEVHMIVSLVYSFGLQGAGLVKPNGKG